MTGRMKIDALQEIVEAGTADRNSVPPDQLREAVWATLAHLDAGTLRVASPTATGWQTHAWLKQAILLYFALNEMQASSAGPLAFYDKLPLKSQLAAQGVRLVPPGAIRYGAHVQPGCVVMPAYVNIGAYVGRGSMIDTWATVGSCAQIGEDVHLAGGVGIGGVLEPPQAAPVIIESGAFIGSRCIVVEGVRVGREAVLGAGLVLTASTPILDVRGATEVRHQGFIPPRSVVVPGVQPRTYAAGTYGKPCALIVGERSASTDRKTSLNAALRDFEVAA